MSASPVCVEPRERPAFSSPDPVVRVNDFFDRILPYTLGRQPDLAAMTRGSISILVHGAGSWCLRFGVGGPSIEAETNLEADVLMVFKTETFVALIDGQSGAAPQICQGDAKLIKRLGELMREPVRGALGVRCY